MRFPFVLLCLLFFVSNNYAQTDYENGFFIRNNGERVECMIKNDDWNNNPKQFEYLMSPSGQPQVLTINEVKEFGVSDLFLFVRDSVGIDVSGLNLNNLSEERNPILEWKTVFLKYLVEGDANLLLYKGDGVTRFFYRKGNGPLESLVYKPYRIIDDKGSRIKENQRYKQQLKTDLICECLKDEAFEKLEYNAFRLIDLFVKFNKCCSNNGYTRYLEKKNIKHGELFNLTLRPRLDARNFKIVRPNSSIDDVNFDTKILFSLGMECEFVLPFNNGRWSILAEPTYQRYSSGNNLAFEDRVQYRSIELPLGARLYFNSKKSATRMFTNLLYIQDIPINSFVRFRNGAGLRIDSRGSFAAGVGLFTAERLTFELRAQLNRDLLNSAIFINSSYRGLSFIFGWRLL